MKKREIRCGHVLGDDALMKAKGSDIRLVCRTNSIYRELYTGPKKKKVLAELFSVTTKTIENTIVKVSDDIVLDRGLIAYRFRKLLPSYIPHDIFFSLLKDSIANEVIKHDFTVISAMEQEKKDLNLPMIPTHSLSPVAQKIIMLEVAIRNNCVVEIEYLGHNKLLETKHIKPQKIITNSFAYYLLGSYDKRNKENEGEQRSFALNGMYSIFPVEYVKDEIFAIEGIGNAYGLITKEKYIMLRLEAASANYFKREGQFSRDEFDFVSEDIDGSVIIKMYYNNETEIVKLIQSWMPLIQIHDNRAIAENIYGIISENGKKFLSKNRWHKKETDEAPKY